MDTNNNNLFIFRTDIGELCSNCEVHKTLDSHPEIQRWSLDSDDPDSVLLITSATLSAEAIAGIVSGLGHQCTEL